MSAMNTCVTLTFSLTSRLTIVVRIKNRFMVLKGLIGDVTRAPRHKRVTEDERLALGDANAPTRVRHVDGRGERGGCRFGQSYTTTAP